MYINLFKLLCKSYKVLFRYLLLRHLIAWLNWYNVDMNVLTNPGVISLYIKSYLGCLCGMQIFMEDFKYDMNSKCENKHILFHSLINNSIRRLMKFELKQNFLNCVACITAFLRRWYIPKYIKYYLRMHLQKLID